MINKLSKRKDLFSLLVKSLCPSIFGNELIKAGMIMSLFGGTDLRLKQKADLIDFVDYDKPIDDQEIDEEESEQSSIRPDIHILIVGEPGLGKS